MPIASIFTDLWSNLEQHEEQGLFLVLVGFILSFAFIRMSTRIIRSEKVSWWPGSVESGSGVHVHHLVFGIVAMLVSGAVGFLAFGRSPATEICAFGFGVGAGLTIDEFALWVHLEDVYWTEEGRSSIDAVVIAVAAMGLVLVGVSPFAIETDSFSAIVSTIIGIALTCTVVAISFLKGRILHGTIGFFFSPFAIYAACRLGKPGSGWARRRYAEHNPEKQTASEKRFPPDRRTERVKNAFRDIVGGKPSEGLDAVRVEAIDAAREVTGTRAGPRKE